MISYGPVFIQHPSLLTVFIFRVLKNYNTAENVKLENVEAGYCVFHLI